MQYINSIINVHTQQKKSYLKTKTIIATFLSICLLGGSIIPSAAMASGYQGLDTSFDGDGIVVYSASDVSLPNHQAGIKKILRQSNGKLILISFEEGGSNPYSSSITRLNTDGTIDTSFGTNGSTAFVLNEEAQAFGGTVESDNSILVAGYYGNNQSSRGSFLLKFNSNGVIDTDFGNHYAEDNTTHDGYAVIPDGNSSFYDVIQGSGGKLIALGQVIGDTFIARYNADGTLDTGFASSGILTINSVGLNTMTQLSDGKIIAAGSDNSGHVIFARFTSLGDLDTSFGTEGVLTVSTGSNYQSINAVAVGPDGRIAAGGYMSPDGEFYLPIIIEVASDGSLIDSFGDNGILNLNPDSYTDEVQTLIFDDTGTLFVGGRFNNSGGKIRAYTSTGTVDTSFFTEGEDSFGSGNAGRPHFNYLNGVLDVGIGDFEASNEIIRQYLVDRADSTSTAPVVSGCSTIFDKVGNTTYAVSCGVRTIYSVDPVPALPTPTNTNSRGGSGSNLTTSGGNGNAGSSSTSGNTQTANSNPWRSASTTATTSAVVSIQATTTAIANLAPALNNISGFKFNKNLAYGSENQEVLLLQQFLKSKGYFTVTPNSYFGPATKLALIKFQKASSISPSVGIFGPITRGLINSHY